MPSFGLPSARAEASRRNGAKSKGPKTPEGKARSAQNALKHGLRAQKYVVLPEEDGAAFEALEQAMMAELAPEGALETVLARRVVAATWRLERAERLESELFAWHGAPKFGHSGLGVALLRDCNGARAFDTLLRYRGGTLAELWRSLRTLKALQAEAREIREVARPDEPECRSIPRNSNRPADPAAADPTLAWLPTWPFPTPAQTTPGVRPGDPESRENPAARAARRATMTPAPGPAQPEGPGASAGRCARRLARSWR